MTTIKEESQELQPTILSYVKDLPNLCSLAGLACTISAIYFSILGVYYAVFAQSRRRCYRNRGRVIFGYHRNRQALLSRRN